eukprot:2841413-Rhodomonas_salina.1
MVATARAQMALPTSGSTRALQRQHSPIEHSDFNSPARSELRRRGPASYSQCFARDPICEVPWGTYRLVVAGSAEVDEEVKATHLDKFHPGGAASAGSEKLREKNELARVRMRTR